jgi:di/tripeptidase
LKPKKNPARFYEKESSKQAAARMVATVFRLARLEVEDSGNYPGWKPEPKSEVVTKIKGAHELEISEGSAGTAI